MSVTVKKQWLPSEAPLCFVPALLLPPCPILVIQQPEPQANWTPDLFIPPYTRLVHCSMSFNDPTAQFFSEGSRAPCLPWVQPQPLMAIPRVDRAAAEPTPAMPQSSISQVLETTPHFIPWRPLETTPP